MISYALLQDLNTLACTTKNKKIENLFLKLAQANQEEQTSFYDWLIKIQGNETILKDLKFPLLIEALKYLVKNRNSDLTTSQWILNLQKIDKINYVTIYEILFDLTKDPALQPYLQNLQDVTKNFANITKEVSGGEEAKEQNKLAIKKDFLTLINAYNGFVNYHSEGTVAPEEHVNKTELDRRQREKENGAKKTRRLSDAFGFFLVNFTKEISGALSQEPAWDKTRNLLANERLPYFGEIAAGLPYVPSLKGAPNVINKIYNGIMSGRLVNKVGMVGAFNYARMELFESLDIPIINQGVEDEPEGSLNLSPYFESGGDPINVDKVLHNEEVKPEAMMNFNRTSIIQAGYILSVSFLLGKMLQGLKERGAS